ncbi:MAG: sodium:solute symporter family protein [Chitinophagales bacterium]
MLAVGFYFYNKNSTREDYYVGGRNMGAGHVGLSVVATDVGGGFSIGLGGLGFAIGISGSWMLFTGIVGAWLSAVFLIPRIYPIARKYKLLSFPQALGHYYNGKVAFIAGIISFVGYIGFTSSQILAGAKLASATFPQISITEAILIMGLIAVIYTVAGGIKAVIYTDTIQWLILMGGLVLIGIPYGYFKLGGWHAIRQQLHPSFMQLDNITFITFFNWFITIVPIWFVGMTLYQRIYACRDERTAKKAWLIAGVFEYPIMAFMGVILGVFGKVAFEQGMFAEAGYTHSTGMDPELGLPLFLNSILPVGLMGIMLAAYFSAIMSTADSCLMAASGNFLTDIFGAFKKHSSEKQIIRISQLITLVIGLVAILLSMYMQSVLSIMLYSYAFMVSGLVVPVLGMLFVRNPDSLAALFAMVTGGTTVLVLIISKVSLPFGLDPNFFGVLFSAIIYFCVHFLNKKSNGLSHA